jgi:hypothetical protein
MKTYEGNKKGQEGERILLIEWTSISFITLFLLLFHIFKAKLKLKLKELFNN